MSDDKGRAREVRLARGGIAKAQVAAGEHNARRAAQRAQAAAMCEIFAGALRGHGWTDVTCSASGNLFVLAGSSPAGNRFAANGRNGRELVLQLVAQGGSTLPAEQIPAPSPQESPDAPVVQQIIVDETTFILTANDALKISGAYLLAINGATTAVTLESGQVLTVTPANATDIAQQLAGV